MRQAAACPIPPFAPISKGAILPKAKAGRNRRIVLPLTIP